MSTPQPSESQGSSPAGSAAGSLGAGIAIAWGCFIGGYVVAGFLLGAIGSIASPLAVAMWPLMALAPWILMIVFAVRLAGRGQSRTAKGIGVGVASILGVVLLLVAACFGLLSNANFH